MACQWLTLARTRFDLIMKRNQTIPLHFMSNTVRGRCRSPLTIYQSGLLTLPSPLNAIEHAFPFPFPSILAHLFFRFALKAVSVSERRMARQPATKPYIRYIYIANLYSLTHSLTHGGTKNQSIKLIDQAGGPWDRNIFPVFMEWTGLMPLCTLT